MKSNVTYDSGVSNDVLLMIVEDLREEERKDFERSYQSSAYQGLLTGILDSEIVMTAFYGGQPIGVLGLVLTNDGALPWLAMTNEAMKHPVAITRETREICEDWANKFGFLYNMVPADDHQAINLLEASGFKVYRDQPAERAGAQYFPFDNRREA